MVIKIIYLRLSYFWMEGDILSYLVELNNITKTFPGVIALNNVSFNLKKGEVHVLLGENGAGKSTLIKVLSGVYPPDEGQIIIEGKEYNFKKPIDATNAGVATIYQEFNLVEHLNIAENVFMGRVPIRDKIIEFIKWKKLYDDTKEILDRIHVDFDPRTKIKKLGVAQKQMIEIAKAISVGSKVLIMDEPTAVLTSSEIDKLFETVYRLKENGVGIIYISHRLEEISEIGDRVTVLRDGNYIDTIQIEDADVDTCIKLMVGRDLKEKFPERNIVVGDKVLEIKNLYTEKKLRNINFHVNKGEILGIAGLVGSGRTEVARAIFGADKISSGDIYLNGRKVTINKPLDAIKHGIAYLTEERKKDGLVLIQSVKENITMASYKDFSIGPFINLQNQNNVAQNFVDRLSIKTPNLNRKTLYLSGGNQQKTIIAKWLCAQADLFIFDEPTRGIDVGAKVEVYNLMNELVEKGAAIIMISSELPEILGMSDRIIVMYDGTITGEFLQGEATQEKLLNCAIGAKKDRDETEAIPIG